MEKLEQTGIRILETARDELYVSMRFLDVALSSFEYIADNSRRAVGTDGFSLFFDPAYLADLYQQQPLYVNRAYFHIVMHCLLRHMCSMEDRQDPLWDLACDIVAESIADGIYVRPLRRSQAWLRRETYRKLKAELPVLTPRGVCRRLRQWGLKEEERSRLVREFYVDDHTYWQDGSNPERQQQNQDKWQDISEQMETNMETFSKDASEAAGELLGQVKTENRERTSYRDFLRKFTVLREEIQLDPDAFDYAFYSYGLQLYGNMPLIEPQESREVQKIEELVIVIDTSMSCSKILVQKFLERTYEILSEQESFFRTFHIHILQCDEQVQTDVCVRNRQELADYMAQLQLYGDGGTDFRPAFAYVNQMIAEQQFSQLKGLLYFTDGQGIYPQQMPAYQTAFIFLAEDYEDREVPPWAIKMILEEEELKPPADQRRTI